MLNVVVVLKVWSNLWHNTGVKIYCDNNDVVNVLNTEKTRGSFFFATCAKKILLITAIFIAEITVVHVPEKIII